MNILLLVNILVSFGEVDYSSAAASITYDRTCPTDCSQTYQQYFTHVLRPFYLNCTVGNLAEVKKFRYHYMKQTNETEILFDAPKLTGIGFYHKHYGNGHTEGALNITFQLPEGKFVPVENVT